MRKFVLLLFVVLVCPAVAADHIDSLPPVTPDTNKLFSEVPLNSRTDLKLLESEAAPALETVSVSRPENGDVFGAVPRRKVGFACVAVSVRSGAAAAGAADASRNAVVTATRLRIQSPPTQLTEGKVTRVSYVGRLRQWFIRLSSAF